MSTPVYNKKFDLQEWNDAISEIPQKEIRPIYSAVIKAFIENNAIKTMAPPEKYQYKKLFGTKIVKAPDHKQDVALGMSDSAHLRRNFSDFPHAELNMKSLEIFANIYAGMLSSRINSKEAYQMSYLKKGPGLDIVREERLVRDAAISIANNFSGKIKELSSEELFLLGQNIAPIKKVPLMSITPDKKAIVKQHDSNSKRIEENFLKITLPKKEAEISSPKKENSKHSVSLYSKIKKLLTPLKAKKTSKERSIWYIDTPGDNTSKKYSLIITELKEEFKKQNMKEIIDINKDNSKEPKNTCNLSKEKDAKAKSSGRSK